MEAVERKAKAEKDVPDNRIWFAIAALRKASKYKKGRKDCACQFLILDLKEVAQSVDRRSGELRAHFSREKQK